FAQPSSKLATQPAWRRLVRLQFLPAHADEESAVYRAVLQSGEDWRARYACLHLAYRDWRYLHARILAQLPGPRDDIRVNLLDPEGAQLLISNVANRLLTGWSGCSSSEYFQILLLALNRLSSELVLDDNCAKPLEELTATVQLRLDEIAQVCLDSARQNAQLAVALNGFSIPSESPNDQELAASLWDSDTAISLARCILDTLVHKFDFNHSLQLDDFDENSFIDRVLFTGTGLPIVKAAIFCGLAARLGLAVRPVNVPDHFMCRLVLGQDEDPLKSSVLVDAANSTLHTPAAGIIRVHRAHTGRMTLRRMTLNLLIGVPNEHRDLLARRGPRGLDYNELHSLLVLLFPDEEGVLNLDRHTQHLRQPSMGQAQLLAIDYTYTAQLRQFCSVTAQTSAASAAALPGYSAVLQRIAEACDAAKSEARRRIRPVGEADNSDDSAAASATSAAKQQPVHPVGAVFRHRRFGYTGVVRGWDPTCLATEEWIRTMGVDRLPRGRDQPFYRVLVEDGSERYVAEENIDLMQDSPIHRFSAVTHPEVGKFFIRRHQLGCVYLLHSALADRYPQDSELLQCIVNERLAQADADVAMQE
uniref:YccV-like domain-containing protein n=1 Tax=Macrostomum lignano TaxID=282301 RepID=A0A1I8H868_9PLAT